ncbi:hypothetical protein [Methylobacterium sp. 1030]|uniref:hypothetical protein n=1 Tax=Methylobacterium sp. 1030 TaxID=3156404 RepID=UPI0033944F08
MGLLGSLAGGVLSGGAGGGAGKAAGIQTAAAEKALQLLEEQNRQARRDVRPWYLAGTNASDLLSSYLGLPGPSGEDYYRRYLPAEATWTGKGRSGNEYVANRGDDFYLLKEDGLYTQKNKRDGSQPADADWTKMDIAGPVTRPEGTGTLLDPYQYQEDPGYQFALDEGNKAIERRLAAQGKIFTPEAVKALSEYNVGAANQTYNDGFQRDQQQKTSIYNMLSGVSNAGQNAANTQIASGQHYADGAAELNTQIGNVQAAAQQAKTASRGSMFSNLAQMGINAGIGYATGGWGGALAGLLK